MQLSYLRRTNRVQGFLLRACLRVMGIGISPLSTQYGVPMTVTGFEPLDLSQGILQACGCWNKTVDVEMPTPAW